MKKRISLVLILSLLCIMIASCTVNAPTPAATDTAPDTGGDTAATEPAGGDQVVSFITWRGEDTTVLKDLVAMFEDQNPGIKINLEITSADITEFYTVLKTRMTSGEGADTFNVHPGAYINEYIDAGFCLDLNPTGIPSLYEDGFLIFGERNGGQYGVLVTYNSIAIYYNQRIFDELGIDVPVTYDDFKAAAAAVSDAGYLTVAAGFAESWTLDMVIEPLTGMYSPDDPYVFRKLETGEMKLTDDLFVKVFSDIEQMNNDGIFQKDAVGTGYDASISLFATEQAAMLLSGTWSIGGIKEMDPDLAFDIFPLMAVNAPAISPILPGQLYAINQKSGVVDASIKWIEFLSSPEGAGFYANQTVQSPTVKGVVSDAPEIAMVKDLMAGKTGDWPDNYIEDPRTLVILDETAVNILKGMDVAQALAEGQAQFDADVVPNSN